MTTGDVNWIIDSTRLTASSDLKDRFQTPLRQADRDRMSKVYPDNGVFTTKLGFAGLVDAFAITGTSESTDGVGEILDHTAATDDGTNVPFENLAATPYYVALRAIERPKGIQINPKTGDPEYIELLQDIGEKGDPDSVVDNGSDLTLNINSLLESGVDHSGRSAVVYMKVAAEGATTEAIAIETRTVAYSAPNNTITTTGLLGQSSPASTTAADYEVVVLGPTVRKNTDLRTVSGIVFLGIVTGAGVGVAPTVFDTSDQRLIDVTLSGFNEALDAFVSVQSLDGSRAGERLSQLTATERSAVVTYPTNGLIYVLGGLDSGGSDVNNNQAYNPATNTWAAKAAVPSQAGGGPAADGRADARAAVVGDTIYLIGGLDGGATFVELVQRYKPDTDTWDTVADDLPAARAGGAVGVINGKIYYAGGNITAGTASDDTYEYNPGTDTWTTVASIATAAATKGTFWAYAVIKNKLYIAGGTRPDIAQKNQRAFCYDPALDQWTRVADIPYPGTGSGITVGFVTGHAGIAVNDVFHIMGGDWDNADEASSYHAMYNVDNDEWRFHKRTRDGGGIDFAIAADDQGVIYTIGGVRGSPNSTFTQVIDGSVAAFDAGQIRLAPNSGIASTTGAVTQRGQLSPAPGWQTTHPATGNALKTAQEDRTEAAAVVLDGEIYVSGGLDGGGVHDTFEKYSPETNTWTALADMPAVRALHGMVVQEVERLIYVWHGTGGVTAEDDVYQYDVDDDSWITFDTGITNGRVSFGYALVGHSLYSAGGFDSVPARTNLLVAYDLATKTTTTHATMNHLTVDAPMVVLPTRGADGRRRHDLSAGFELWVIGGEDGVPAEVDTVQIFESITGSWQSSAITMLSSVRAAHGAVVVEDEYGERRLIVAGGRDAAAAELTTEAHNLDFDVSASLGNIGSERLWPWLVQIDGRVFIGAGNDFAVANYWDDMEILDQYTHPVRMLPENISASYRPGDRTQQRVTHEHPTIGFKASEIYGVGSWDAEATIDVVKVGEN